MRSGDPSTPTWNFPCSLRDPVCRRMRSRSWSGCTGRSIASEPPHQSARDAGGGPASERRAARGHARPRQLLRRRGSRRSIRAHCSGAYRRGAHPADPHRHRRRRRFHDRIRRGRAGLDAVDHRPAQPPDLPRPAAGASTTRSIVLQTLGHFVLGHQPPTDYGDFLRQRVEANYFAAALLIPEEAAVDFLRAARHDHALAVEDLRCLLRVVRNRRPSLHEPGDPAPGHARALRPGPRERHHPEGVRERWRALSAGPGRRDRRQLCCRHWASRTVFTAAASSTSCGQYTDTPRGTYWCSAHVEETSSGRASVVVGVPFDQARWFRIPETSARRRSSCPDDPTCCRQPPAELAADWADSVWPSARAHSHLVAAMPPGTFPGVDETDVLTFVASRASD